MTWPRAKDKDYGYSSGVMLEVAARTSAHDGWGQDGEPGLLCPLWRWLGGGRVPSEYVSFRLDQAIYNAREQPGHLADSIRPALCGHADGQSGRGAAA